MSAASWFGVVLSAELLIIALAYGWNRDWPHCGYYVSASVLNAFVVAMG